MGEESGKTLQTKSELQTERDRVRAAAVEHLRALGKSKCGTCQGEEFLAEVAGVLVTTFPFPEASIELPPPFFSTLVLTCRKCGLMRFHNLKVMGIVR